MKLKYTLAPGAKAPLQATEGAAGLDLSVLAVEDLGHGVFMLDTGVSVEIPEGYVGLLFPRSSLYRKFAALSNSVGVVDSDYRGTIKAVFYSGTASPYAPGERAVQLVLVPVPQVVLECVDSLTPTVRGSGGFGSTGG